MEDKNKKILAIVGGLIVVIIIILLLVKGCGKKEYVINFDSQGGSNVSSVTVLKDDTLTKPKDPTREGYEFLGWYLDGKLFDFSEKITKNMVLEARWEKLEKDVTGISLNATSLTLKPDGTGLLSVIFTPEGATTELVWSSSDEDVVTVKDGALKALKKGEVTITVTTKDGQYKATCKVKVEDDVKSVTSVSISGKKEVNVGESIKLTASIKPKDATNKEVTWTSSNPNIATVDKNGNVKGIKSGKVTITVTTVDGEKKASISIDVKEKKTETTTGGGTTGGTSGTTGESNPSTPSTPTTPEDKPSTPTNPSTGNTPSTGEQETPKNVAITSVKLSKNNLDMKVNAIETLTYTYEPSNASIESIEWKSSDTDVATVENGKVKALDDGTADITITIKDKDGNIKEATCKVTVSSVYVITLTANPSATGGSRDYTITSVTKNGNEFTDFISFTYIGKEKYVGNPKQIGAIILANKIDESVTTATMRLSETKVVNVTIEYKWKEGKNEKSKIIIN